MLKNCPLPKAIINAVLPKKTLEIEYTHYNDKIISKITNYI